MTTIDAWPWLVPIALILWVIAIVVVSVWIELRLARRAQHAWRHDRADRRFARRHRY